jgi:hypothetical protein
MNDIVERLRRIAKELPQTSGNQAWLKPEDTTAWEAADEIERLRVESAKLAASNHSYLSNYQEALAEIERLRAGGCARDQTTTQYCAEAVALQSENACLKDAIHDLAKHISRWDWWSLKPETHALVGEKE